MFHPDEDRTDVFEIGDIDRYDQPASRLAKYRRADLVYRHARILCEEGYPQARFRQVVDQHQTLWADDTQTMEIECTEQKEGPR